MSTFPQDLTSELKSQALHRVLNSRTFRRSGQLRAFLKFVCDSEISGTLEKLNEQAIGVAALGRPADYSPAEDSCVRTRAYELRNKLRTFYEQESPREVVRIHIAKGGYVPAFTAYERNAENDPSAVVSNEVSSEVSDLDVFWLPFRDGPAPLLLVFDLRLFFFSPRTGLVVRHYRVNDPRQLESSEHLSKFREQTGEDQLLERHDYSDFGSVHAAFLFGRLFARHPHTVGMKHAGLLDWQDVYNSHLVFVGKPDSNPVVVALLEDKPFRFDPQGVIHNEAPTSEEALTYDSASTHGSGEKHALITRLHGPQPNRHILLLCGTGAELMWALAQSVTELHHIRHLVSQLIETHGSLPESFQVVIRASFQQNVPVDIRCVAHRVLSADSGSGSRNGFQP